MTLLEEEEEVEALMVEALEETQILITKVVVVLEVVLL